MSTESCSQLLAEQQKQNQEIQQKQDEIAKQLSSTLGTSIQALTCGPTCQREKEIEVLKQKYLDAQTNKLTAPQNIIDAEKAYYTYAEGTAAYDAIRTKELQDKANALVQLMQKIFIEELYNIGQLIKMYNILVIDSGNTLELYNDYEASIEELNDDITNEKSSVVTNDRKTYYENQEITGLKFWQILLFWIYYILVFVFFIGIFFADSSYSFMKKFGIFILLAFYPLYAGLISKGIMWIIHKVMGILPKNVYKTL